MITKFRAWDKVDKRMIYDPQEFIPLRVTNIGVFRLNPMHKENLWELCDPTRFEIMQWIQRKDFKDVDIYDNDIITPAADRAMKYKVTFINTVACLNNDTEKNFYQFFPKGWIIIGNTFENPELLN